MHIRHFGLALAVALLWGANFSVMKIGMEGISPIVFSGMRSLLVLPLLFFIPKPKVSWKIIITIGLLIGTFKLPLMLFAIHLGVATGLTSLIIQIQAFFTTLIALALFNQKPTASNWIGMCIAFTGIGLISIQVGGQASIPGLIVILISALFWASANLILQQRGKNVDMLSLMVWINIVPPLPLFGTAIAIYGWDDFEASFQNITWVSGSALLYGSLCAGILGYTIWGTLLKKYPAAVVAPFSLLVPVFGISFAYFAVNETLTTASIYGCFLVIFGLIVNQLKLKYMVKSSRRT
jgi:O-acetylserine/cysteine efflux transporter